jgi:hypothetical protein
MRRGYPRPRLGTKSTMKIREYIRKPLEVRVEALVDSA